MISGLEPAGRALVSTGDQGKQLSATAAYWANQQPYENTGCVILWSAYDYLLNDIQCLAERPYVCERH